MVTCHGDIGEVCSPSQRRRAMDSSHMVRALAHSAAWGVLRLCVRAAPQARHILALKRLHDVIFSTSLEASVPSKKLSRLLSGISCRILYSTIKRLQRHNECTEKSEISMGCSKFTDDTYRQAHNGKAQDRQHNELTVGYLLKQQALWLRIHVINWL